MPNCSSAARECPTVSYELAPQRTGLSGWRRIEWFVRAMVDYARYADPRLADATALRQRVADQVRERLAAQTIDPLTRRAVERLVDRIGSATDEGSRDVDPASSRCSRRRSRRARRRGAPALLPARRRRRLARRRGRLAAGRIREERPQPRRPVGRLRRELGQPHEQGPRARRTAGPRGRLERGPGATSSRSCTASPASGRSSPARSATTSGSSGRRRARADELARRVGLDPDAAVPALRVLVAVHRARRGAVRAALAGGAPRRAEDERLARSGSSSGLTRRTPRSGSTSTCRSTATSPSGRARGGCRTRATTAPTTSTRSPTASAVVGINTSALVEAAVVGQPTYTVLDPEFEATQEGHAPLPLPARRERRCAARRRRPRRARRPARAGARRRPAPMRHARTRSCRGSCGPHGRDVPRRRSSRRRSRSSRLSEPATVPRSPLRFLLRPPLMLAAA